MANSTKKAPIDDGRSYISQLETVGSGAARAPTPACHDSAARTSDGESASAIGPAAPSRAAGPHAGLVAGSARGSTGDPSAGNTTRSAVSSSRTAKVTAWEI